MDAITNIGRLPGALVTALLLAGCAAGANPTAPTAPAPSATPTAAFTPAAPERTYVSGTMSCRGVGEEDPSAADTDKYGDLAPFVAYIDCDYTMSDPRVTGTEHYTVLITFAGLEAVNGTANFWTSTSTLETKDGRWTGSGYGSEFVSEPVKPMVLFTNGTDLLKGEGALAGLTYRVLWARERPMSAASTAEYAVSGWIEPAD
jgi:hypothetical protein